MINKDLSTQVLVNSWTCTKHKLTQFIYNLYNSKKCQKMPQKGKHSIQYKMFCWISFRGLDRIQLLNVSVV